VHFKTISLDGTKPNTNPKTNPNPKLTLILTLFSCFMLFFEHRPLIFSLAKNSNRKLGTQRCKCSTELIMCKMLDDKYIKIVKEMIMLFKM